MKIAREQIPERLGLNGIVDMARAGDTLVVWRLDRLAAYPGAYFSDPYDIHSEGILIPGVRVVEKGVEKRDILRLIFNNVRLADGVRTDSYAMIAATQVAQRTDCSI